MQSQPGSYKHFYHALSGLDVRPVIDELAANSELWNKNKLRTTHPETAHGDVSDIWMLFNDTSGEVVDDIHTRPYPAWFLLNHTREMVLDINRILSGTQLGRVIITRLPPGGIITPHVDGGAPATYYSRFQLTISGDAEFHIGDESVIFQPGELWLINNTKMHSVINNGDTDRLAIIIDVKLWANHENPS